MKKIVLIVCASFVFAAAASAQQVEQKAPGQSTVVATPVEGATATPTGTGLASEQSVYIPKTAVVPQPTGKKAKAAKKTKASAAVQSTPAQPMQAVPSTTASSAPSVPPAQVK